MKLIVNPHKIEIEKTPVNEKEIDITKIEFEFIDIPENYVKDAYFTLNGTSYKVLIVNNECNIPYEVLTNKGQVEIGVVAYLVEDEEEIKRYNPSPVYISTLAGSLKEDYENTEPITPTDKEQMEQAIQDMETKIDNLDIDAEKADKTTTITITKKDGTQEEVEILDGEDGASFEYNWQGTSLGVKTSEEQDYQYVNLKGDKGDPGAIKMIIVNELPETGEDDTIYLVPITPDTSGNNYAEYVYINGAWELLGKIGVQVDLTDYVKNTDYASSSKGGVIKATLDFGLYNDSQGLRGYTKNYTEYLNGGNGQIIGKGTLENVITGKGLVSNTDYATSSIGGVVRVQNANGLSVSNEGFLYPLNSTYATYQSAGNTYVISKGTLENVLTARIGDIATAIDLIQGEVI